MAILKLKPACKDYIWGGRRLIEEYGFESGGKICAEAWTLSAHPDGASIIENGEFSGKTLAEYIKINGEEILGTNCRRFKDFPVLVKLIDAREKLSFQVHPNDEYALLNEDQLGKSEMWYIIDAKNDSWIYCGLANELGREEFRKCLEDHAELEKNLNFIRVRKGDVFFIPPGTIHAIGGGIFLAEIQQNSNVSYRIYDYGRGRPLHIKKAGDVVNLTPYFAEQHGGYPHLAACDYFAVDKLFLDGKILSAARGRVSDKTFMNVLIIDGVGQITCGGEEISYRKGDSFFLTAKSGEWAIRGTCDALLTTIPNHEKNI